MKGLGKFIGGFCLGALVVSAIPYSVKRDEETGALEIRSLLWALKKTPGEEKDNIAFAIPPSGLDYQPDADEEALEDDFCEEAEAPAEAEEPAAE